MPRKLRAYEFGWHSRRAPKYERFLDGNIWEIKSDDFPDVALPYVRNAIATLGRKRGLKVQTSLRNDVLVVRATAAGGSSD